MITLTTNEQSLVRFKVDSRVTEKDLPNSILTSLAEEAENDLKLRLSTAYSSLPVTAQALYRTAVINLTAALGVASVRPQVHQRAGPVSAQWAWEQRDQREKSFRALYESNIEDLVASGHGATISGSGASPAFEVINLTEGDY